MNFLTFFLMNRVSMKVGERSICYPEYFFFFNDAKRHSAVLKATLRFGENVDVGRGQSRANKLDKGIRNRGIVVANAVDCRAESISFWSETSKKKKNKVDVNSKIYRPFPCPM